MDIAQRSFWTRLRDHLWNGRAVVAVALATLVLGVGMAMRRH